MKTLLALALAAFLCVGKAQTPATPHDNPTPAKPTNTADYRADSYQGPKVVKNSKALGKKMVQKSKPTDMMMRLPMPPVKK